MVVSPQFFAWMLGFGAEAQLLEPRYVVEELQEHIRQVAELYSVPDVTE